MTLDLPAMEMVAKGLLGVPFLHRGRDPSPGLDCSGLAILVYAAGGFDMPDYVGELQAERDDPVDALALLARYELVFSRVKTAPAPGDMLISSFYSDMSDHVAIVLRNGYAVHAVERIGVIRSKLSLFSGKVVAILRPRLMR